MRFADERARNLFARLFAYSPRPRADVKEGKRLRHRNALEDYCTEGLAWCLINSDAFRNHLFAAECFATAGFTPKSVEVETQVSFRSNDGQDDETVEESSDRTQGGKFDLVLKSLLPEPFLVVIECKVAPDAPDNLNKQIADYRRHVGGDAFKVYNHKLLLLLTPYGDKHTADAHLSWDRVYDAITATLADPTLGPEKTVLQQLADFLKMRNLVKVKLPSVAPLLGHLKETAPLLVGLQAIFESLGNDELGRAIFRKDARLPKMDIDEKSNVLWYGIWSRGAAPIYYIGFHTSCSGNEPLLLSLQVSVEGNRRAEVIPDNLKKCFNKKESGEEDEKTNFIFTKEIKTGEDNPAAIEEWLITQLRDVKTWVDILSKGPKAKK